jgi:AcrR family transcriptional regulator
MTKRNPDRRAHRTHQALMSAFVELVLARGYEVLTTGEICRKANVGRSTFYLHYASKEELLKESIKHPSSRMAACVDGDVTPEQLTPLLDHFREQRAVNRVFFEYPIRPLWVKCLAGLIEPRLPPAARSGSMRPLIPQSLVALTVAEMQIALITHWLTGRFSLKSGVIAAALITNTRAMLAGISPL